MLVKSCPEKWFIFIISAFYLPNVKIILESTKNTNSIAIDMYFYIKNFSKVLSTKSTGLPKGALW